MNKKKTKLIMGLSFLIIGFLISSSSINTLSTKALVEEEDKNFNIDSLDKSAWKWNATEVVSTESTGHSFYSSLAVDSVGNTHVAWYDSTNYGGSGTDADIFYKRWDASSSSWTITEVVSTESTSISILPSLAVDSTGTVHIAWQDATRYGGDGLNHDIFYKRWNSSSSSWTITEVVSIGTTAHSLNPSLAVDDGGDVHVVWYDPTNYAGAGTDDDILYRRWNSSSSSWNTIEVVSTESTSFSNYPSLAVDSTGNVHVVWRDATDYGGAGLGVDIFYKRWNSSSFSWTITEVVSTESTSGVGNPSLSVDTLGNIFVAWSDYTDYGGSGTDVDIFYKRWDASSSSWTTTEVVSTESTAEAEFPSLAVDSTGNVHVAWEDDTDYAGSGADRDIFYKKWGVSSSSWTTTEVVSTGSTTASWYSSLAVDSAGTIHISWEDLTDYAGSGTDKDIFHKLFAGPPAAPELAFIVPIPTEIDTVNLDWNNIYLATTYYVYRSTSYIWSVEELVPITTVSSSDYIDSVPSEGFYYYVVVAGNFAGNSSHSNCQYVEVKFTDLEAPTFIPILPNPTEVNSIVLDWTDVDGVVEYYIYRSNSFIENLDGLTPHMTIVSDSFAGDTLLSAGIYFYVVVASDGLRNSTHSNCQYVEVKFTDLEAPELAPILPNPTEITSISLVWDSIDGAIEYYIYRSVSYIWSVEGLIPIATVGSNSYVDTLPTEGIYLYVIVASDGLRNSTHSNCEYVEYKLPTLHEFAIVSGLIAATAVFMFVILRTSKNKSKLN